MTIHTLREIIDVGRIDPAYIWGCDCGAFGITRCPTRVKAMGDFVFHWRDQNRHVECTCETVGWCDACRPPTPAMEQVSVGGEEMIDPECVCGECRLPPVLAWQERR